MRFIRIWDKLKKYWLPIAILILGSVITIFSYLEGLNTPWVLSPWVFITFTILCSVLTLLYQIQNDKSIDTIKEGIVKTGKDVKSALDKKVSLDILNKIIEKGIIGTEEIYRHMPNSDVYCLICFAYPHKKLVSGRIEYKGQKRLYPKRLTDMGFVRVNKYSTVFITTPKRLLINPLPRSVQELRNYIANEIDKTIPKEWEGYLKGLSRKRTRQFKLYYQQYKDDDYKDHLKFSIALIRGKLDEKNIKSLYQKHAYSNEFEELLREEVDFRYIDLPQEKRIKIKSLFSDISIDIFLSGIDQLDLRNIVAVEPKLKGELSISCFTDYLNKSDADIYNILEEKGISKEKAKEYTIILKETIEKYRSALHDLGISV